MFVKLSDKQVQAKVDFIKNYAQAGNAADGSLVDSNANVSVKNIATLNAEINKDVNLQVNRRYVCERLTEMFGEDVAKEYVEQIKHHTIYKHDETSGIMPYTYGAQESVIVDYKGNTLLLAMEDLYATCEEVELLADDEEDVWVKYPNGMFILDRYGRTPVYRLVKKGRHKNLVLVKTQFGENLVVTEDHPMITSEVVDDTTPANDSVGKKQYRIGSVDIYSGVVQGEIDVAELPCVKPVAQVYDEFIITVDAKRQESCRRRILLNEDMGYFVGFFIAEGWFSKTKVNEDYSENSGLVIKQKGDTVLRMINEKLYRVAGICGNISPSRDNRGFFTLYVKSRILCDLFLHEFEIGEYAQNKSLPTKLFQYSDEFKRGLLAGIIDGDGTVSGTGQINIRLSSRKIISQLSYLFKHLGFTSCMSYQDLNYQDHKIIKSSYPIFGIQSQVWSETQQVPSLKMNGVRVVEKGRRYGVAEWADIADVKQITNEYFLNSNEFIYDITTASHSFVLNNLWVHNCAAVSMYPFLLHGLKDMSGESKAPKHLDSFCGAFVNLIFALSSQFAGACATGEWLMCFDHFARKDYGDDYLVTHPDKIKQELQHTVYALNQPAAARNYQCVKEDTELLTPQGFKKLHELHEGDECYTWRNGELVISKIKKLNVHDYDGHLMEFAGRGYKQTVTPNHRVLYKVPNTDRFDLKEAAMVYGHSKLSLPIACSENNLPDYEISDDMLKMCAFILTDGTINKAEGRSPYIVFYKSQNRWGGAEFVGCCERLGLEFSVKGYQSEYGMVDHYHLTVESSQGILSLLSDTKKRVPDFFRQLSKRQAQIVLDVWSKTDGMNRDGQMRLQCDNAEIADAMQHVAFLAGYGSEQQKGLMKWDEKTIKETIYVIPFLRQCKRVKQYSLVPYKGKVWCPTTDDGVVIFREEGRPFVSGNSVFWNISIFDQHFFKGLFEHFVFPDGSKPTWESLDKLQRFFLSWFNKERETSLLTFPVVTAAMLVDPEKQMPSDMSFAENLAQEMSEGNSFFIYTSDSVDSLSSCCRLRNAITENEFSYTLGAVGVMTGSISVITMNMNRFVQDLHRKWQHHNEGEFEDFLKGALKTQIEQVHKYHAAYRKILEEFDAAGMLSAYKAGFIALKKQYSTIGINGMVEAAEYLGKEISVNDDYLDFVSGLLKVIHDTNVEGSAKYGFKINTEFVPAENLGVKNAKWDKEDGYFVPRDCYNSYFYIVESDANVVDKFMLHGKKMIENLDGGSAYHMNLEENLTKEQWLQVFHVACKSGCNYFTYNVLATVCKNPDCGHIAKKPLESCPKCGGTHVSHATRIIGYLKEIRHFGAQRRVEAGQRFYNRADE